MAEKRRGLGRGLGALIPSAPEGAEPQETNTDQTTGTTSEDSGSAQKKASNSSAATGTTEKASASKNGAAKSPVSRETVDKGKASSTKKTASGVKKSDSTTNTAASKGKKSSDASTTASSSVEEAPTPSKRSAQSPARRADMGAALRKSSGGRRPVDFFFQSSADSEAVTSDSAASRTGDSSVASGSGSETDTPVSRETEQSKTSADETESGLMAVPGARFVEIPVQDIHPNRKQPRQEFDPDDMAELVHSIKEIGVLQPIVVRPSQEGGPETYELVMGERRWRATQEAGLETIPAIIRETQNEDLLRDALLENLHRSQLNPLEEAAAYQQLLHEFNTTQEELSKRIGRSRPQISNTIRLLRLPALVQRRVAAGILSAGHARALLSLQDPAAMERLAQRIVAEGLSVRGVEEIIQSGAAEGQKKKPRKATPVNRHHERFDYIADAFADKLDTSVKINVGARKGKMTIEFASVEDLNRIISVLDPDIERG